jgi:hypothetical protein
MIEKFFKIITVLVVFLYPVNLLATVADLRLRFPFPEGETWHTSCTYNGVGACSTHGATTSSGQPNRDRYALDFNYGVGSDDLGKSIRAAATGRAEIHYGNTGYGNYVLLHHGNGYVTRYAHLQNISVKNNKWVLRGQEVGKCGSTGNSSSPHLHFALYHNGQATKPEPMGGYDDLSSTGYFTSANGTPVFRTIVYESDEFKGALVLVREDNIFPQDCNNNDQVIFYRQWRENGEWSNFMEVVPLESDSGAYEYCLEATVHGFIDVDLEGVIEAYILVEAGVGGLLGGLPPVSGEKTDLTPDFDIYNTQGQEISSNHSDDPIKTVYVGQQVRLNLTTEVHNDDTENHLRDDDSDSIEGPVYYWIEGVIPKTLYVSEEFDVDDLDKGDEPDEEEWFIIPNYPGHIISFQAEVDGDDEVDEESEDNNTSRVERLQIVENPNSSEDFGTSRDNLSDAKKAAIIHMILTD